MTDETATMTTDGDGREVVPPSGRPPVQPPIELADYAEIARMAGTTVGTVRSWRERRQDGFPDPSMTIGGKPLWLREDIETWLASRPVRRRVVR